MCKVGVPCNCCTTRKSAPRNRKKDVTRPPEAESYDAPITSGSRTPSHILARLAELRPVLPRPSYNGRSNSGPSHNPSLSVAHGHASRHHSHENILFSPYGRAYDFTHEQHPYEEAGSPNQNTASQNSFSTPIFPADERMFRDQLRALEAAAATSWNPPSGSEAAALSFPSTCGCGDNCRCPGCVQHNPGNPTPASAAFSSCTNPGVCTTCLDCTILSLPASLPPDTSLSIYDAYQTDSIDEWIRQVSSLPRLSPAVPTPPDGDAIGLGQGQPPNWDAYLPRITEPPSYPEPLYTVQPCCGVLCKCSPEDCECDIDDENGYDCRNEMLFPTFNSSKDVTSSHTRGSLSVDIGNGINHESIRSQSENGVYLDLSPAAGRYHAIPEPPRSRSSSTSSQSSRGRPLESQQHQLAPFTDRLATIEYSYAGNPAGRVRGPFGYTGSSVSSPNLGLKQQLEYNNSLSGGSSPSSISPTPSASGNGEVSYPASNPDSDGYVSADDRNPQRRWRV